MSQRKTLTELLEATPPGLCRASGWDDLDVLPSELAVAELSALKQASQALDQLLATKGIDPEDVIADLRAAKKLSSPSPDDQSQRSPTDHRA